MIAVRRFAVVASLAAPAAFAGPPALVQPGLWSTTITVTDVAGADLPPEAVAALKGRPRTYTHCVTPEEAAKGPRQLLAESKSCSFSRFNMAGGKLDAAMSCPESQMTATTTGTYSPSSYNAVSRTVLAGADGMRMTASVVGRRTGACK